MVLVLDRIEEGIAVFENPETEEIFYKELPDSAKVGDVFDFDTETQDLTFNSEETEIRKKRIEELADMLFIE